MENVYLVTIWEYFIEVACLILLSNSMAEARILLAFFPGQFSATLTGSLSNFFRSLLQASHLLQQVIDSITLQS